MLTMAAVACLAAAALAENATVLELSRNGIDLRVDADRTQIDPARSVFLRIELKTPADRTAALPDLRDRVKGFSLAEDFVEEPQPQKDGSLLQAANWRLVPEPCAKSYKVRPFVVKASPKMMSYQSDEGKYSFYAGPVTFEQPAARDHVTGGIETDPEKDLPPLSWKLVGWIAAAIVALASVVAGVFLLAKYVVRRVKEHRMSPIERAWVELDRLLKKGLPGRGRYKDFYVELTMVVRRYVQRKYGIRAPHLTTDEFLAQFRDAGRGKCDDLAKFLESADLVKFAGVEATPDMADDATDSARSYLKSDAKGDAEPA